jgi:hypothetical protein
MKKTVHRLLYLFAIVMWSLWIPTLRADAPPATQPISIEFLNTDAARAAIIDDSADPYFSRLEDHEMSAKTSSPITGDTHMAKIAECKKRYQAAVMDFTDEDKAVLKFFVEKFSVPLKQKYPVFGNTPWSFIKISDTLEGGMPHTRGAHVILPEGLLARFAMFKLRLGDASLPIGGSLLIHEQTHVLERLHPELFVPLFTDTFHFVQAKKIEASKWLTDRQLLNPDGTVANWIYPMTEDGKQTYILPLITFDEPNPTNLKHGISMIAVTMAPTHDGGYQPVLGDDGNPIVRPLREVTEYVSGPGAEANNYHPNEIIADRFAEVVVMDDLLDAVTRQKMPGAGSEKVAERLKPIRDWAKPAFALTAAKTQ